jgi:hypothetical protein
LEKEGSRGREVLCAGEGSSYVVRRADLFLGFERRENPFLES